MIELNGISLNNSLILSGYDERPLVSFTAVQTLGNQDIITIDPLNVSYDLVLQATSGSLKQGWFCSFQIDLINDIMAQAIEVPFSYYGEVFNVYIINREFEAWFPWEPPNANKRYSGIITLRSV